MNSIIYIVYLVLTIISLLSICSGNRMALTIELIVSLLFSMFLLIISRKANHFSGHQEAQGKKASQIKNSELLSLESQKRWLELKRKKTKSVDQLLKGTIVYSRFKCYLEKPIKFSLTDADWNELQGVLEKIVPVFKSLIDDTNQLSVDDIR